MTHFDHLLLQDSFLYRHLGRLHLENLSGEPLEVDLQCSFGEPLVEHLQGFVRLDSDENTISFLQLHSRGPPRCIADNASVNHRGKDPAQHDMDVVLYLPLEVYLGNPPLRSPAALMVGRGYDKSLYSMSERFVYHQTRISCAYGNFRPQDY
jgi:hypothetical protein